MFDLSYKFNGLQAQCQYAVDKIDGQDVVVFIQTEKSIPSITNAAENIAQSVLDIYFRGVHPDTIKFYLHYPQPDALISWEEVGFEIEPIQGALAKFFGAKPKQWQIHSPRFSGAVSANTKAKLAKLISR